MTRKPEARPSQQPVIVGFERHLSVAEVADILRRSPRTIRDWIIDGCPTPNGRVKLQAAKLGRSWTVRPDWLAVFEFRVRAPVVRPALDLDEGGEA